MSSIATPRSATPRRRATWARKQQFVPLAFTICAMMLFATFFLWPAALGLYYSFTNYRGVGTPKWVGGANYVKLLSDDAFYRALKRTLIYTCVAVPLNYVLPLFLAVLLVSKSMMGSHTARVFFFIPWLVSPIITGVIFRWMFGESFGFVNFFLQKAGLAPHRWQTNPNLSLLVVLLAGVWGGTAFAMLLFIAALKNIPRSYYEAASIDGASEWKQFWRITLPLLRPTSFMVILLSTIGSMKEFAMIQALNGGGPGTSNYLMVQYIYNTGFERARIGYAAAASMVLMVILLIIALVQMRIDRASEMES